MDKVKVRYKDSGIEDSTSQFNTHALAEVLLHDDSPYILDLDVWLEAKQEWKDMMQAFRDKRGWYD